MLVSKTTFLAALKKLTTSASDRIVVDLETNGLEPFSGNRLIGVALLVDGEPFYYPYRHGSGDNLPFGTLSVLLKAMARFKVWTTWNGKFDIKFIEMDGGTLPEVVEDVMLAAHLMDENAGNFRLKDTAKRLIKADAEDESEILTEKLRVMGFGKGFMWILPADEVYEYAEMDVILTEKLRAVYVTGLEKWGIYGLWQDINKYLKIVNRMESRGMLLDTATIAARIAECDIESEKAKNAIESMAGFEVNPNSAPQILSVLSAFGIVAANTRVDTLESIDHPVAQQIVNYRRWNKAKTTYYEKFLLYADQNGVLHPNLNMIGTVTGRFSSSSPNLQAIPRAEEQFQPKNLVKSAFVARPGYLLVQVDYKQAEVYLGAAYAQAEKMFEFLQAGVDVHRETANLLGIPRPIAKRLNFSMQYGIGAKKFAANMWQVAKIRITEDEAAGYIRQYNTVHPEFKQLYYFCNNRAESKGYIRLFTGRVRRYNGLEVGTYNIKASPAHKASSNLIQGGVAEIMRLASTAIHDRLGDKDVHQLLHVHDSIMLEVPIGRLDLVDEIGRIMTDPAIINVCTRFGPKEIAVPFAVDIEVGTGSWHDLIPLADYKKGATDGHSR